MKISQRKQAGIALIMVLFAMMMAAAILALSLPAAQTVMDNAKVSNDRIINAYICESAAARAQWLLINDVFTYANRNTMDQYLSEEGANEMLEKQEEIGEERVMADGTQREYNWADKEVYKATLTIDDAVANFNFNGTPDRLQARFREYFEKGLDEENADGRIEYETMRDQFFDYIDADDATRIKGGEKDFYEQLKLPNLPRNNKIQTVEELFWVPAVREKYLEVDDEGIASSMRNGLTEQLQKKFANLEEQNASFSSSNSNYLSTMIGNRITDEEKRDQYLQALKDWRENGTKLYENLDDADISSMRNGFSDNESGLYMITVEASSLANEGKRKLKICFALHSRYGNQNFAIMAHRYYFLMY